MNIDQSIIIRNDADLGVSISAEAAQLKETALAKSALIGRVTNAEENEEAARAQTLLADLRRSVEKARKEAKQPVLDFGRKIDAQAEEFIAEVAAEEMRISKRIGDFFQLEQAKVRAAEAAKRLEAERIERERLAELQRIADEQARAAAATRAKEAEAAKLAREATNAKQRAEAEALRVEAERQAQLAAARSHEQLDAINEQFSNRAAALADAPVAAPVKAAGQTVKADLEITVTDIHKLYKFHPNCVNLEPRISDIKSLIHAGGTVHGVTSREVFNAQARSTKQQRAIEV